MPEDDINSEWDQEEIEEQEDWESEYEEYINEQFSRLGRIEVEL